MGRWAKFTKWMTRRPSGGAAGAFAVMDELFHPSSREAIIAAEERTESMAPRPAADDKPFGGKVVITLPESASTQSKGSVSSKA